MRPDLKLAIRAFLRSSACVLFLIALCCLAFSPVQRATFLNLDDNLFVAENPHLQGGFSTANVFWALKADLFFSAKHSDYWQPMTFFSRMVDVELFGMNPAGHHRMNLVLHTINAILLYLLLLRLTSQPWPSLFAAALFAIHPLQTETVAWVTARKDLVAMFWSLLLFHTYTSFKKNHLRRWIPRIEMPAIFLFCLMSKPMTITLPFLLILLDLWPLQTLQRQTFRSDLKQSLVEKWPLLLLAMAYLPVPFLGQPRAFGETPLLENILHIPLNYFFYLQKAFLPTGLGLYGPAPLEPANPLAALTAALALILITVMASRLHRSFLVGWLWFLITLTPVIGLLSPADRFMYLPLIGLMIMVVWGINGIVPRFRAHRVIVPVLAIVVIAVLTTLSHQQVRYWQDSTAVCERAIAINADNFLAHTNLGTELRKNGQTELAKQHFEKAIRIQPRYALPYTHLAGMAATEGDLTAAADLYQRALHLYPEHIEARSNYGSLLAQTGHYDEALRQFEIVLRQRPTYRPAQYNHQLLLQRMSARR